VASIGSVLARLPKACAQRRTWVLFTTPAGSPAAARLAAATVSKPPVASTATASGGKGARRAITASRPLRRPGAG